MSTWATRCNACGTSFRVSEEQLSLSEGYVRCGRCDAVFNARATLFDLEAAAPAAGPVAPAAAPAAEAPMPVDTAPEHFAAHPPPDERAAEASEDAFAPTEAPPDPVPVAGPGQDGTLVEPVWQPDATSASEDSREPQWGPPDADRMLELLGATPPEPEPAPAPAATWSSLRERKAAPRTPRWAVASGGALAAALLVALPVHWAWIERDALRARHSALDSWLATHWPAAINPAGWRHLEGLSVSSSSLRATPQGGAYQLELVVQNRATHALAMPWLDLSLSDGKGQLLLRRAVDPAALTGSAQPLGVNEQRKLQAVFTLQSGSSVSGYEINLFHP